MTRAFAYARVSTGEQAKGFSLEAQFEEIKRFCDRNGIEIINNYSDTVSGSKLRERQGLMSMLNCIDSDNPEYVIATESDRISRNTLQFGWIDTHLSMKGSRLLLVNEKEGDGPAEKAFQRIRVVFSEFETDLRQWRINRGRIKARENNRFMNRPPFGYMMSGKDIVPDSHEMPVVKKIFYDYSAGTPIKRIAREIGKNPSAVRYILKNKFYVNSELNGNHNLYLDEALFQRVQDRLIMSKQAVQRLSPLSSEDKSEKYLYELSPNRS